MTVDPRLLVSFLSACFLIAPQARAQGAAPARTAPKPAPPGAPAPAAAAPTPNAPPPDVPPAGAPIAEPPGGVAQPPGAVPYYQEQSAEAPPAIYVAQPPLPPLTPRTRYYHDGFYLRLSSGFSYMNVSTSLDGNASTGSVSGAGGTFDVMVGGSPAPGLVVGGGVFWANAFDPGSTVTRRGATVNGIDSGANGSVSLFMVGPMIDAFPMPTGGFHFGGMLGLAGNGLKDNQDNFSGGVGLSVWTGYMWWVSGQWSLGGMLRFNAAWTRRKIGEQANEFDAADSTTGLTIAFSAAYH
jgi:hypothetical protein